MKKIDRQTIANRISCLAGIYKSYREIAALIGLNYMTICDIARKNKDIDAMLKRLVEREDRYKRYNIKSNAKIENDRQSERFIDCKNYLICLTFSSEYNSNFKFHCNKCNERESANLREQYDTYHNY